MLTFKEFYDTYKDKERPEAPNCYCIKLTGFANINVDCSDVKPLNYIWLFAEEETRNLITLYNCNRLNIFANVESPKNYSSIQIQGDKNQIGVFCHSHIFVKGSNNVIESGNYSYSSVVGNNNIISAIAQAGGNCESGENNIIRLHANGNWQIREKCVNSFIVAYNESEVENYSSSSSILCFEKAFCRTVKCKSVETFGDGAVYYWTEKTGKRWCREPIDDKCGYFYKAVAKDLAPILWNDYKDIIYTPGTYVYPDDFTEDTEKCGKGIHFFGTITEAVNFASVNWLGTGVGYKIVKLKVDFEDIAPIAQFNYEGKMRARKVYVDSIVPEEEYEELKKRLKICYDI